MRVLVLDEDRTVARSIRDLMDGVQLHAAYDQATGLSRLRDERWDLLILDLAFSNSGLELLERLRSEDACPPIVLLAAEPSMESAVDGIRAGALDVLPKPPPRERLRAIIGSLGGDVPVRPVSPAPTDDSRIIGTSEEMLGVYKAIARAAASSATVLILGESGTGKEMAARVLHSRSSRASGPFVTINCAAIPEHLLESELFGHEKGAFTGAIGRRIGRFERADGGTLFLDEIGDMSLALQSKILRALQEREIERVGGGDPISIDVRVLAATNRDLDRAVAEGAFREDLFYRLAVVTLRLPRLRQRGRDMELLAEHFVSRYAYEHDRPIRGIAEAVFPALESRSWPGNVRQLRNVIERAVVMAEGAVLAPNHLPPEDEAAGLESPVVPRDFPLCTLEEMERRMVERALRASDGKASAAAEILGIHRNTLRRKIDQYGIDISG